MKSYRHTLATHATNIFDRVLRTTAPKIQRRVVDFITGQYDTSTRLYHNTFHIVDVLDKLNKFTRESVTIIKADEVSLALLLHDIIYDCPNLDGKGLTNEEKSARLWESFVAGVIPELYEQVNVGLVSDLIRSTEYGNTQLAATEESDDNFKVVHDIDFSSMGGSYIDFTIDGDNIRQEYWFISDEQFEMGRKAFLAGLLKKDKIYLHPYFQDEYEVQARENITEYLANN